jgi:hypothetical protein
LAACRDTPEVDFFIDSTRDREVVQKIELAKTVCAGCRVRLACLEFGMRERYGIWGGLTFRERKKLSRARQQAA